MRIYDLSDPHNMTDEELLAATKALHKAYWHRGKVVTAGLFKKVIEREDSEVDFLEGVEAEEWEARYAA